MGVCFYIVEAGLIVCVENVQGAMARFVEMEGTWNGYKVGLLMCMGWLFSEEGHVCVLMWFLDSRGLKKEHHVSGFWRDL